MSVRRVSELRAEYESGRRSFESVKLSNKAIADIHLTDCSFVSLELEQSQVRASTFVQCRFSGGSFRRATIGERVQFVDCTFSASKWSEVVVEPMTFARCDFTNCDFSGARFKGTQFDECRIDGATFRNVRLTEVSFGKTLAFGWAIGDALIVNSDISGIADSARSHSLHGGISLDWRSICRSLRSRRLEDFLLLTDMPDVFASYLVECARALDPGMLFSLMQSTFISYGAPDAPFARKLQERLTANGVHTFLFERDAPVGKRLHRVMFEGINKFDRVILICSRSSLIRKGVQNEVEETFAREARDGGASYLLPITVDDHLFSSSSPLARRIRDRVVADFRGSEADDAKWQEAFFRLLAALRRRDKMPQGPGA